MKNKKILIIAGITLAIPLITILGLILIGAAFWWELDRQYNAVVIPEVCEGELSDRIRLELCQEGLNGFQKINDAYIGTTRDLRIIRLSTQGPMQAGSSERILLEQKGEFIGDYTLHTFDWNHGQYFGDDATILEDTAGNYIYFSFDSEYSKNYQIFRFDRNTKHLDYAMLSGKLGNIDAKEGILTLKDGNEIALLEKFYPIYLPVRDIDYVLMEYDFNKDGNLDILEFDRSEAGNLKGEDFIEEVGKYLRTVKICTYQNGCILHYLNLFGIDKVAMLGNNEWQFEYEGNCEVYRFNDDKIGFLRACN